MNLHPAKEWVAPTIEKAAPASPADVFTAGNERAIMATYFEKLKDPRWQKKRLEALEHSGWACDLCADTEETLHVHHKQYFKGREPWEYEVGQLAVLCKACHKESHGEEDLLLLAASFVEMDGPRSRDSVAFLVAGFCDQGMPKNRGGDPGAFLSGQVANEIDRKLKILQCAQLHEALARRDKFTVREAMGEFIESLNSRPDAEPSDDGLIL